jgi:hypothetical protein
MLKPCLMCDSIADATPMPAFAITAVECGKCGRYLIGDYLAASLPQTQLWSATRERLSLALRWASDRGTPADLKLQHDVMWLLGQFDMSEQDRADQEHRIADALVAAGEVQDVWVAPIHAVDRALKTTSDESRKLVADMLRRGVVQVGTRARLVGDPTDPTPILSWWEKGSTPPEGTAAVQTPR